MMTDQLDNPTEHLVRASRRSLYMLLCFVLGFGAVLISVLVSPHGTVSRFFETAPWAFPILVIGMVMLQRATMGKQKWDPRSPEVKAIIQDELRRASFDRASRITLFVILFLQVPLAFFIDSLAPHYPLLTMAVVTVTISVATLLAFFLFFDRE